MRTMRSVLLPLALVSTVSAAPKAKPLLTTDLIYGTADLLLDIQADLVGRAKVLASPIVAPLMKAASEQLPKDPVEELCKLSGVKKSIVMGHVTKSQDAVFHFKSVAAAQSAKVYEPLSTIATKVVDGFEQKFPKYAGLIPKNLGDFALFCVYISFVLYFVLRVVIFFVRTALCVFCFFCCCGCCCRRGKKAPKAEAKGGKAADKGKAAAATAKATAAKKPKK